MGHHRTCSQLRLERVLRSPARHLHVFGNPNKRLKNIIAEEVAHIPFEMDWDTQDGRNCPFLSQGQLNSTERTPHLMVEISRGLSARSTLCFEHNSMTLRKLSKTGGFACPVPRGLFTANSCYEHDIAKQTQNVVSKTLQSRKCATSLMEACPYRFDLLTPQEPPTIRQREMRASIFKRARRIKKIT